MTVPEVAEALGLRPQSVRKAIVRGTLAATSVPGYRGRPQYEVDPAEVERYRREHRTPRRVVYQDSAPTRQSSDGGLITEAEMRAMWGDR